MRRGGKGGRSLRIAGAALGLVGGLMLAAVARGAEPTPTPGPAARAGEAIDHTLGAVRDDVAQALLVARVRVALLEHFRGDGLHVHIKAHGDEVELSGKVERRYTQELATKVARSVTGVGSVRNRLTVTDAPGSTGKVSTFVGRAEGEVVDALTEARVKARLIEQLGRAAFAVEVEASEGVVSLSGKVPDTTRRTLAVEVATRTSGVARVIDLLKVSP
ncbi:MAG: BON domain-containing protein [Acidobacteriota bacterium]